MRDLFYVKLPACSLLTYIRAGHSDGLLVNGLAVGVEGTGIRPLPLIALGKDLFKLGRNKSGGAAVGIGRSSQG